MKPRNPNWQEQAKKVAAREAIKQVKDGDVIGLGSGTTVAYAIMGLGRQIKQEHLKIFAVPSSYQSYLLATQNRMSVTTLDEHSKLNLTIDGADQVETKTLNMIKGMGGALTREKIIATASKRVIIMIDETKIAQKLGLRQPVPIEVLPFALATVSERLVELAGKPRLRGGSGKVGPVMTDNGNFVLDVDFGRIEDAEKLNHQIKMIPGVIETGLFLNMASVVYVGMQRTVRKLVKE